MAAKEQNAKRRGGKKGTVGSEGEKPTTDKHLVAYGDEIEEPPMIIKGSSQGPIGAVDGLVSIWELESKSPLDFNFDPTQEAMPSSYKLAGTQQLCSFIVFDSLNQPIFEFPNVSNKDQYEIIVTPQGSFFLLLINGNSADCTWKMQSTAPLDYNFEPNSSSDRPNVYTLPGSQESSGFVVFNSKHEPIFKFPNANAKGTYTINFRD